MDSWESLRAKRGQRILPRWQKLIKKAEEAYVVAGKHTRMTKLPSGGVMITGEPPVIVAPHPWSTSSMDQDNRILIREGLVAGRRPWITEKNRVGDRSEEGSFIGLQLKPKDEGHSYIAVGVNISASSGSFAEIDPDGADTWTQLRLQEINELPKGFGSGGVTPDKNGWAWYPLVRLEWDNQIISETFQIVRHSLSHIVVRGDNNEARHFFPPV